MKHLKKFLLALSILLLLTGCGSNNNPEAKQAEEIKEQQSIGFVTIDHNNVDLKEIPIMEGKVNAYFTFRNSGSEPVVLLAGQTSCMCTEAVVESSDGIVSPRIKMGGHGSVAQINQVLEPGEEARLIATFDPLAHGPNATGPITRDVLIQTNSKETPELKFSFQGNVIK